MNKESEVGKYKFVDLVKIEEVQKTFKHLYQINGVGHAISDPDNNVLVAHGWREICTKFHRVNEESVKRCEESDSYILNHLDEDKFLEYKCKNGMWDAARPIIVEGQHLATVFVGQFFYDGEAPDREVFLQNAEKYGFDKEAYLSALDKVPYFSREFIKNTMKLYSDLAAMLSEQGLSELKLRSEIGRHKIHEKELIQVQERLDLAIEGSSLGLWEMDLASGKEWCSAGFYAILGYKDREIDFTFENFINAVCPEDRDRVCEALRANQEGNTSYDIEYRITTKTGQVRWVHARWRSKQNGEGKSVKLAGAIYGVTERNRIEAQVRALEQKYRLCLDNSSACTKIVDRDFNLQYMSRPGFEMLHLDEDSFVYGEPYPFPFFPELFKRSMRKALKEVKETGEIVTREDIAVDTEGDKVWLYSTIVPINDDEGTRESFLVVSMDISDRKQKEDLLRVQSAIAEHLLEGVYLIRKSDGIIVYANQVLEEEMFGYDRGEMIGKEVSIVNAPADGKTRQEGKDAILAELEEKGTWQGELKNVRKDGSTFWSYASVSFFDHPDEGRVLMAIHTDITEQKETAATLKVNYARYAAMISNISDVIGIVEVDGMTKYQSPNIEKWFGWKPEDLIGKKGWDKIHPEDVERVQKEFSKVVEHDYASMIEYRFKCKDGNYKWIELTANNRINDPVINGVLLNYHDISERKQAEDELVQYRGKLEVMVGERTKELAETVKELQVFYEASIDRELKMEEMSKRIKELEGRR